MDIDYSIAPYYPKYFNEEHIKNAVMCKTIYGILLRSVAKFNETDYDMVKNVEGYATTEDLNFFKFDESGNVFTSQITYKENKALNMSLHIYTDPYYFEFTTPIDYYVNNICSVMHPTVTPQFSTINKHTLDTIETLILLRYEYI